MSPSTQPVEVAEVRERSRLIEDLKTHTSEDPADGE
jgi:hypothetical protein